MLSVLFKPQFLFSFLIFSGQMEGFPPSSIEEDVNMISDELDLHSLLSELELHSYVILKHILSEDDCLQFSYFSLSYY